MKNVKTSGPYVVPPNHYGNEIQIFTDNQPYDDILGILQTIQKEYPEFDITLINTQPTVCVNGEKIFLTFRRDGRESCSFLRKEYTHKELKNFIVAMYPLKEHAGSFVETTIFDDNGSAAIYNDGIFLCMGPDGDRDILEMARQRKIDLYFERYETNYGYCDDDGYREYPKKMSAIFKWFKDNKGNSNCILRRIEDDILRPPQYKERKC
jgi:hypothetical protein